MDRRARSPPVLNFQDSVSSSNHLVPRTLTNSLRLIGSLFLESGFKKCLHLASLPAFVNQLMEHKFNIKKGGVGGTVFQLMERRGHRDNTHSTGNLVNGTVTACGDR